MKDVMIELKRTLEGVSETLNSLKYCKDSSNEPLKFKDLKSNEYKQFLTGMAYATALVSHEQKTMEPVFTGSVTMDEILADIKCDVYSYLLTIMYESMEDVLSRMLRHEKENS